MEDVVKAITLILAIRFPGCGIELEETIPGIRVGGSIVAPQFVGVEQIDRQRELWAALRENLTPEQLRQVGTILTYNPYEVEITQEAFA